MKNLSIFFLIGISLAPELDAMWLLNDTNENGVIFTVTLTGRKNSHQKNYTVPAKSMINDAIGAFQATNQMSGFGVTVRWNSGATICQVLKQPGSLNITIDLSAANADNYNAILFRDAATNQFRCAIRLNPAGAQPGGL